MPLHKSTIPRTNNVKRGTLGKIAAGIGVFLVAERAWNRAEQITTKGTPYLHTLFISSFLRGISNAGSDTNVLDHATTTNAERATAQNSSVLEQIRKDFNEAYSIQEAKFEKGAKSLGEKSDRAKDFLFLPKKEMLALDRSARSFLLREFGAKKGLSQLDSLGHAYSAGTSVILMNTCRLGGLLGGLVGKRLSIMSDPASIVVKLMFLSHFLNKNVTQSNLGSMLGFGKFGLLLSSLEKLTNIERELERPIEKAESEAVKKILDSTGIENITAQISAVLEGAVEKILNSTGIESIAAQIKSASKKVTHEMLSATGAGAAIGGITSGPIGAAVGAIIAKLSKEAILASKTCVMVPAAAGLFDGLLEPVKKSVVQRVEEVATEITEEDQRYFISSIWEDYWTAYDASLKKFQKYDQFLARELETTQDPPPMVDILKKNSTKGKKSHELAGRELLLSGDPVVVELIDMIQAATQTGKSVTAATSYRLSKKVGQGAVSAADYLTQKASDLKRRMLPTRRQREHDRNLAATVRKIKRQQEKNKGRSI